MTAAAQITNPAQESSRAGVEYPFGKLAEESTDKFYGARVRVHPVMQGDAAWIGEVGMVLKHGRLLEVAREGRTLRIRVEGGRIELMAAAPKKGRRQITWRGEAYDVPSDAELERWVFDSVCETPDGDTVEPDHPDSWLSLLGFI